MTPTFFVLVAVATGSASRPLADKRHALPAQSALTSVR